MKVTKNEDCNDLNGNMTNSKKLAPMTKFRTENSAIEISENNWADWYGIGENEYNKPNDLTIIISA